MRGSTITIVPLAMLILACPMQRPESVQVQRPEPKRDASATHRPVCHASGRATLRASVDEILTQRAERQADRAESIAEVRDLLRAPCLAPLGVGQVAELGDDVLLDWFWRANGASWIQRTVLHDPAKPVEFIMHPPTPVHDGAARAAEDPLLANISCSNEAPCDPLGAILRLEAERAFLLEALEFQSWFSQWAKPLNKFGFADAGAGEECAAEVAAIELQRRGEAWLDCVLGRREQRALLPIGEFRGVVDGTLELSWIVVNWGTCRAVVDLEDGSTSWLSCAGGRAIPVDVGRRIAFHAILRPHLVVGSPTADLTIVPPELGPVALSPRAIGDQPSPQRTRQVSHSLRAHYVYTRAGAKVEGECHGRWQVVFGESAVCSLIWDLYVAMVSIEQ